MRILAAIGVCGCNVVTAVGAAIFFFGGYFNVAASEPNPGIVNWALVRVRMASIDRRPAPSISTVPKSCVPAHGRSRSAAA